jgi:hypothetical protein
MAVAQISRIKGDASGGELARCRKAHPAVRGVTKGSSGENKRSGRRKGAGPALNPRRDPRLPSS